MYQFSLRENDTLGRFSAKFKKKGDNFWHFLFALLSTKPLWKWDLALGGKHLLFGNQFFLIKWTPREKGTNQFQQLSALQVYPFPLNDNLPLLKYFQCVKSHLLARIPVYLSLTTASAFYSFYTMKKILFVELYHMYTINVNACSWVNTSFLLHSTM